MAYNNNSYLVPNNENIRAEANIENKKSDHILNTFSARMLDKPAVQCKVSDARGRCRLPTRYVDQIIML